jgi:hypothetical protein
MLGFLSLPLAFTMERRAAWLRISLLLISVLHMLMGAAVGPLVPQEHASTLFDYLYPQFLEGQIAMGAHRPSFSLRELARVLLIPVIAVAILVFVFVDMQEGGTPEDEEGLKRIPLVQKDSQFRPIPADAGGASGSVWYTPSGKELSFQLQAQGLAPRKRYLLEMAVGETIYTLASHEATKDGELAVDTTLTSFAEGVCVGPNYDPPRSLQGEHAIRFWLKADGNPPSGSGREHAPQFTDGQDLPCAGNGDGDYTYVLFENELARFTGT